MSARAPVGLAVHDYRDVADSLTVGMAFEGVFLVCFEGEVYFKHSFEGVRHAVQTSVSVRLAARAGIVRLVHGGDLRGDGAVLVLDVVCLCHLAGSGLVEVSRLEDVVYLRGLELRVLVVGNALDRVAEVLRHFLGECVAVLLLQQKAYAALARLGVYADNVAVVLSADVVGVDRQIGDCPLM